MVKLLRQFATAGFIALAIDDRYHGARRPSGKGTIDYTDAILSAYHNGFAHPILYDTVWDITRLIDWLVTLNDVDSMRISLIGFSKGGIETYLAAAADPRIAGAVSFLGVQSFGWALEHDAWQPRIGTIQPPSMLPRKAPDSQSQPPCSPVHSTSASTPASPMFSMHPPCSRSSRLDRCSSSTVIPTHSPRAPASNLAPKPIVPLITPLEPTPNLLSLSSPRPAIR